MKQFYNVGKIVNTHGIRGEVRVISMTDFPEKRYKKGSTLFLFMDGEAEPIQLDVKSWRKHKNFDLLSFSGYDSINDVEPFKGGMLKVSEDQLTSLPEGEYYYHEIIGCTVKKMDGEEIGNVSEILSPGANDVWVVKGKGGREYYIPYIKEIVKNVDIEEKTVWIEPMEGLLD